MVAFKYRWLAAFLPFIDIKKQKSIISDFMPTDFPNSEKKQTHNRPIFKPQQPTSWDFYFQIMWYNKSKHSTWPD